LLPVNIKVGICDPMQQEQHQIPLVLGVLKHSYILINSLNCCNQVNEIKKKELK